jgi:hypothetical protein
MRLYVYESIPRNERRKQHGGLKLRVHWQVMMGWYSSETSMVGCVAVLLLSGTHIHIRFSSVTAMYNMIDTRQARLASRTWAQNMPDISITSDAGFVRYGHRSY